MDSGVAEFRGIRATGVVESIDVGREGARLASGGFWVMVGTFEGDIRAWRFEDVRRVPPVKEPPVGEGRWEGPDAGAWTSSLDREAYVAGVERIRDDIREGDVYQANLCRILSAPLPAGSGAIDGVPDARALSELLAKGNPARYASRIVIPALGPDPGTWIVSASPELFLGIDGTTVRSSPIKGTAAPGERMLEKDVAENIMITDLIRNDLSRVAVPGLVEVLELLAEHEHPGLAHLQSTVAVTLAPEFDWTPAMWPALLDGTFPPGSVSGAPKSSALRIIAREETAQRGPYCGAIGWIDADARCAELAVGIRTFWWEPGGGGTLRFGTGAGITWGSDPEAEWKETELKARRLIRLASGGRLDP
ncbi:MAG: chorismate-binding protein [Demequinaceae bacterium]|nr:chorismate-binding protein [Demequinaceae bacterium]